MDAPATCARPGFAPRTLVELGDGEDKDDDKEHGVRAGAVVLWLLLSLLLPLGSLLKKGICGQGNRSTKWLLSSIYAGEQTPSYVTRMLCGYQEFISFPAFQQIT
jgi:hypothetical protein